MIQALRSLTQRWTTPPPSDDPDALRVAAATLPLALLLTALSAVWVPLAIFLFEGRVWLWIPTLGTFGYASAALLVHRRRPVAGARVVVATVLWESSFSVFLSGSVASPLAATYAVSIAVAALLLDSRAAVATSGVAVLALLATAGAEAAGWLPAPLPASIGRSLALDLLVVAAMIIVVSIARRGRRARDAKIAEASARFAALAEAASVLIAEIDLEGRFVYLNAAYERLLGRPPASLLGRLVTDIAHPEELGAVERLTLQLARRGNGHGTWRGRAADGSYRFFEADAAHFEDASGRGRVLLLARDVTAQLQLVDRQRRSERLESLGQLAGGVAHDFNNYLTVILGSAEQILADPDLPEPIAVAVSDIRGAAGRSAELTQRLLAFSRHQLLRPRVIDLNRVLGDLEPMLRRLLPATIDIDVVMAAGLGRVRADVGRIEQVIVNLAVNARDAMPDGGRLTLETADVLLGDGYVEGHPGAARGRYVLLSVSDTGHGMDPETQRRAFEPFFTTKPASGGTGFGLAATHGIVRQSGGIVELYSEPGVGTTVKVYLPRVEAPVDPVVAAETATTELGGSERVLLVEDQEMVRTFARGVLESNGYRVVEARHGLQALEIFESDPDAIDLIVTDVVLPQLDGLQLIERVRQRRPALRVVYMSGYTADGLAERGLEAKAFVLEKPFTARKLLERVREALAARAD